MAHDNSDGSNLSEDNVTQDQAKERQKLKYWLESNGFGHFYPMFLQCKWDELKHFERCDPIYDINQLFNDVKETFNYTISSADIRQFRTTVQDLQKLNSQKSPPDNYNYNNAGDTVAIVTAEGTSVNEKKDNINGRNNLNNDNDYKDIDLSFQVEKMCGALNKIDTFMNETMLYQFNIKTKEINLVFETLHKTISKKHKYLLNKLNEIKIKQNTSLIELRSKIDVNLQDLQESKENVQVFFF